MSSHLTEARIDDYVLFGAADEALEAHVCECDRCASLLAAGARFEIALHDVADGLKRPPSRLARSVVPLLLAAAAILLIAGGLRVLGSSNGAVAAPVAESPPMQAAPVYLADSGAFGASADAGVATP